VPAVPAETSDDQQWDADVAKQLIERERSVFEAREQAARSTDAQATGITAAIVAVTAIAANGDILDDAEPVLLVGAGAAVVVSALSAGIARLPATLPPNAYSKRARRRILANHPQTVAGSAATTSLHPTGVKESIRLGRDLGKAIRDSENDLRLLGPETSPEAATAKILRHWRLRNGLARYRMHSKSSWLSFSILWLFIAAVFVGANASL
jgi:hypothetical protein